MNHEETPIVAVDDSEPLLVGAEVDGRLAENRVAASERWPVD